MTVVDTSVRHYKYTDPGAPSSVNTTGRLLEIVQACLIDGFGSVTLDSLAVVDGVATATVSAGHGFTMLGNTGSVIRLSGATTQAALNGDWRISSIPDTQTFTFITDTADVTEAGTVSVKIAPLDWSVLYSGTNKAIYQSSHINATGAVLSIQDLNTTYANVYGAEGATDVDTLVNQFTPASQYWVKPNVSTSRPWYLIGDDRLFFFFTDVTTTPVRGLFYFGDFVSNGLLDSFQYNAICRASGSISSSSMATDYLGSIAAASMMRGYSGAVGGINPIFLYGHGSKEDRFGHPTLPYPAPVNNKLIYAPIDIWQSVTTGPIGYVPGLFTALHSDIAALSGTVLVGSGEQANRDLLILGLQSTATSAGLLDITGPWR